ncbi:MAG: GAF domain-containing protein [Bacilli bacterium]
MLEIIKEYTKNGNIISQLGNISSICMEEILDLNWVGFYIYNQDYKALVLGPFNGKKATSIIDIDKGVCGSAFSKNELIIVDDVHNFCGHIACDIASSSELVIPLHKDGEVIGVMDIDSPIKSRFDADLVDKFKEVVDYIENYIL